MDSASSRSRIASRNVGYLQHSAAWTQLVAATQRAPLTDQVVKRIHRPVLIQPLYSVLLLLAHRSLHLAHESFEVTELIKQRLVRKELDVLCIVVGLVCCAAFVDLLHTLWLVRIDALQDTQASESRGRLSVRRCVLGSTLT